MTRRKTRSAWTGAVTIAYRNHRFLGFSSLKKDSVEMISAIFKPSQRSFFATSFLIPLVASLLVPTAAGQEKRVEFQPEPAMSYSVDSPAWLEFVAKPKAARGTTWWPDGKLPSWSKSSSPGWWSSSKKASSYSKSNKTTMQKFSQTSKRWWSNTAEFLDPYAPPKERASKGRSDGGFFGNWFGGGSSEPKFNSVPEWAAQPMPK
jgi:hypothetical protein